MLFKSFHWIVLVSGSLSSPQLYQLETAIGQRWWYSSFCFCCRSTNNKALARIENGFHHAVAAKIGFFF